MATSAHCGRRIISLLNSAGLLWPCLSLLALLNSALLSIIWLWWQLPLTLAPQIALLTGLLLLHSAALFIVVILATRLCQQLLRPLVNLEQAVARVCQGEPGASESLQHAGVLATMARDISSLNTELTELYEDMDVRVARQTLRLAQKTASLKILYDVAASINQAEGLDAMLRRFLRVLKNMVNGRAATVRLLLANGEPRFVGAIGLNDSLITLPTPFPPELCFCGLPFAPGGSPCNSDVQCCSCVHGRTLFGADEIEVVTVPLKHHEQLFGTYTIFVERPGVTAREDIMELLATIGQHIGVAIAKQYSDDEARRLSVIEERNTLAHELHDSLAQTLASLRLQMRMLTDTLQPLALSAAAQLDLTRLRNGIDEAHHELRELLANFRAPLEPRGLLATLQQLAQRFEQETGIRTLFQSNCQQLELSAAEALHVVRIAQESLHNIRKHAQAHTVRLLLMRELPQTIVLLIEDDGIGFNDAERVNEPQRAGEHIGLSILAERARRIGGRLHIESELGEGTRVELRFQHVTALSPRVTYHACVVN